MDADFQASGSRSAWEQEKNILESSCCEVRARLPFSAFPLGIPLWLPGEPFHSVHGPFPPTSASPGAVCW